MTEEQLKQRDKEMEDARKKATEAKDILERAEALRKEMAAFAPNRFGVKTKGFGLDGPAERVKRIRDSGIYDCKSRWDEVERREKAEDEKRQKELKAKQESDALIQLQTEAVVWLQERGKVLGTDFTVANALSYANDLAFDDEVAKRTLDALQSGGIGFSGEDSCEDCSGWDGQSRRCNCGNRRVNWESGWGHSFKTPHIDAVAY